MNSKSFFISELFEIIWKNSMNYNALKVDKKDIILQSIADGFSHSLKRSIQINKKKIFVPDVFNLQNDKSMPMAEAMGN